ncbi:MAG: FHA domain-containing protein, partial [Desulfobacterales bacterium]|nr:FHA domain-containing protein [Desulfobacterales bacterium]
MKNNISPYFEIKSYETSFDSESILIGRDSEQCKIVLDDSAADMVHAVLKKKGNSYIISNQSIKKRIQVGHEDEDLNSVILKISDKFSIGRNIFQINQISRFFVTISQIAPDKIDFVCPLFLNKSIKIGSNNIDDKSSFSYLQFIKSPYIPLSDGQEKAVALLSSEKNGLRLSYLNPSDKMRYQIRYNNYSLALKEADIDLINGEYIWIGKIKYKIELKQKKLSLSPLSSHPRIFIGENQKASIVKTGMRILNEPIIEIPFHLDKPIKIETTNEGHLKFNNHKENIYRSGQTIDLHNSKGDTLSVSYIFPKNISLISSLSPVQGSKDLLMGFIINAGIFAINIFTGSLNRKTHFIYNFILFMSALSLIIAGNVSTHNSRLTSWTSSLSIFLIIGSILFVIIT